MTDKILLEKDHEKGLAVVTLNRADKRNALDGDMIDGIVEAFEDIRDDPQVHVVLTRAEGPTFCAGMDLHYLRDFRAGHRDFYDWGKMRTPARSSVLIANFPKVTVAAVQGYVLGGGFSLMMSHDVVVVAADAQLGMPEVLRGSFGQGVTAQLLKQGIPKKKVVLLQLLGRNITGAEAERLGLVTLTAPVGQVDAQARAIAAELALRNPAVLAHGKIAAHLDEHLPFEHAMFSDDMVAARMRRTIDPLADVEGYLKSQKGGPNRGYARNGQQ